MATLDLGGKLSPSQIPSSLVGAVVYRGTWDASGNEPILTSGAGTKGDYYKVNNAGTTTLDGISVWNVGDTAIFDGATWDKLDGIANEMISFNGRYGVVVPASGNYAFAQIGSRPTTLSGYGITDAASIAGPFAPSRAGASAAGQYVGVPASGAPATGTFAVGDWVTTRDARRWTCTVAGTPGTWVQEAGTYSVSGTAGQLAYYSGASTLGSTAGVTFNAGAPNGSALGTLKVRTGAAGDQGPVSERVRLATITLLHR